MGVGFQDQRGHTTAAARLSTGGPRMEVRWGTRCGRGLWHDYAESRRAHQLAEEGPHHAGQAVPCLCC